MPFGFWFLPKGHPPKSYAPEPCCFPSPVLLATQRRLFYSEQAAILFARTEISTQTSTYISMKSELLRSHDELRTLLRLAGMEIRKRRGNHDSPLLQLMRKVLKESRGTAKAERAAESKGAD